MKPSFLILVLLVSFGSVGAVLFTPALPLLTSFFGVSIANAQWTISSYLIGYALGQLPYGPLANRFGRKVALYIGISLSIVGALLCALSPLFMSFELLVFARFIQALGAAVGLKVSFTMIGDVYQQIDATKILSRVLIAFAIMPGAAVFIGGWLTKWLSWESCFYFLILFGFFALWAVTRLPETAKSLDVHALKMRPLLRGYTVKFLNPRLIISGLMMGCGSAIIYIFASKAPFISIDLVGLTPDAFGTYNLIPLVGMLLGALLSEKLAGRFPFFGLLLTGIVVPLFCMVVMLILFAMSLLNPASIFVPMFIIYMAEPLVYANVSSFGLSTAKNKANGSAVLNFVSLLTTVIAVFLSASFYPGSALFMPVSFIIIFLIMILLWLCLRSLTPPCKVPDKVPHGAK